MSLRVAADRQPAGELEQVRLVGLSPLHERAVRRGRCGHGIGFLGRGGRRRADQRSQKEGGESA
jgi:hypothetical protein